MQRQLVFLEHTDPEFAYAFGQFADPEMYNAELGEALQYMGTVIVDRTAYHEFRHRAVPGTNLRQYWKIPCSMPFYERVQGTEFDEVPSYTLTA